MTPTFTPRPLSAALVFSALACTGLLAGCDNPPDTIKIGVAQPLTGNIAGLGQDLLNGVKLATAEINKEGFKIKGKPVTIELVVMDDRSDPATGKAVAQQLVDAGVVAVIANLNSGVSIEAAPVYGAHNIAQLAISTNPKFTQLGLATTFRIVGNDTLQAKAIGSYAANQLGASKFAILDDGTPYGKGLADGAAEQLTLAKKEIVVKQSFNEQTKDFAEVAEKMKSSNVEVLITTLGDYQVLSLLEYLKKIDYTQLVVLGGDTIKTTDMLKGDGMVKAIYSTSPILDAKEFANSAPFLAKYQTAYKMDPTYGAHYTYDAMYVLASAITRAGSADPKKITDTLRTFDGYAPVTGSMKWDKTGEQRYGVVGVYAVRKGAWALQMRSDRW